MPDYEFNEVRLRIAAKPKTREDADTARKTAAHLWTVSADGTSFGIPSPEDCNLPLADTGSTGRGKHRLENPGCEPAMKLKAKSPAILKLGLDAFYTMSEMEFSKAITYLREMVVLLLGTEDARKGVGAFMPMFELEVR